MTLILPFQINAAILVLKIQKFHNLEDIKKEKQKNMYLIGGAVSLIVTRETNL